MTPLTVSSTSTRHHSPCCSSNATRVPAGSGLPGSAANSVPGPARGARSATVVGPDAGLADALATALVVAGREGAEWFAGMAGWEAWVVDPLPLATAWSVRG